MLEKKIEDILANATGITTDSRLVNPGYLFIAMPGMKTDGCKYAEDAIKNGAIAVIKSDELQQPVGEIAAKFYNYPSRKMTIIGITGTNGKTSCSHFIASCLQANKIPCGIIGTLGFGFPGNLQYGVYTTPHPVMLQQQLSQLQSQGAKAVVMEVSSHGLEQGRVAGVEFDIAVFTNLSQDHLDYHGDMQSYGAAKKRLFHWPGLKHAVINIDDAFGQQLLADSNIKTISYSMQRTAAVQAHNIKLNAQVFTTEVTTPWGDGILTSKLLGRFNVSNLLAVLAVLGIMKIPLAQILSNIAQLDTIPGRMQTLGGGKQPLVVIDFAHTPDALKNALMSLREHCHGALWCVFGCGGDRDRSKRPIMGQIAEQYSDYIIITDDNPRTESSKAIIDDILQGLLCPWAAEIERDRGTAIARAIDGAKAGDMVLIAGKGHEPYQIVGAEKIPFSDVEQVKNLLI